MKAQSLLLFSLAIVLQATEATISPAGSVELWHRAEFVITGIPQAENSYDPECIRVDAEITLPSGAKQNIPAFWTKEFTSAKVGGTEQLNATGNDGWRLRFMPTEPGRHKLQLILAQAGAEAQTVARFEFIASDPSPADRTGWVQLTSDRRGFETSDGRILRLTGENLCWASGGGTYDYEAWFDELHHAGQNVARLWMCPWWLGVEQQQQQPTQYQMDAAWRLDRIFELAEQRGIYLVLCLDYHGMLQVDNPNWGGSGNWWPRSPYHQNQGGPGLHPNDFFTSPRAKELYKKRLRYLIGRYSGSPHLLAWQFFNEIDNVYAPHLLQGPDVVAWHVEMARWLKTHDPYKHLITTSLTGGSDRPEIWSLPEMDFSVYHSYGDAAPAKRLAEIAGDFLARYQKPVIIGEYGVDWRGWGGRTVDPHLRAQRQALWGSALSSAAGTALSWWWEEIHADRVYPVYAALASVLKRGNWFEGSWTPARHAPVFQPISPAVGNPIDGGSVYSGPVALGNVSWLDLPNEAALTGALSAQRASETLSGYLHGTAKTGRRRPVRLDAWWAPGAALKIRITEVGGAAEFVARINGVEALRQSIPRPAVFQGRGAKVDIELALPIPAGRHSIELENTGEQWLYIGGLHSQGVQEASFADGWEYPIEVNALRQGNRAILYAVSPWAVYPAGATTYRLPPQRGRQISLFDWSDGNFVVTWYDPETGAELAKEQRQPVGGTLTLVCPDFDIDLAAIVRPLTEDQSK